MSIEKRRIRKLEKILEEEEEPDQDIVGPNGNLYINALHDLANGDLDPEKVPDEALEKVEKMAEDIQ